MLDVVIEKVRAEADRAAKRYGHPSSTHESLGVLLEEFDELRQAIHGNDLVSTGREAIQIAACAIRLASACLDAEENDFATAFGERSVP